MRKDGQSWKEFFCNTKKNWWLPFLGITVLWIVCWYLFSVLGKTGANTFDAISSLFSGLAFAGIIITTLMQNEELKLQRRDLDLTRKEIKGQREELEQQNKTLVLQRFETTFFNMLSQHNEMVSQLLYNNYNNNYSGRVIFKFINSDIFNSILNNQRNVCGESKDKIVYYYDVYYQANSDTFGTYFRSLYAVFQYIRSTEGVDKIFYSNIVRSQMTGSEVALLFMNGLSSVGYSFVDIIYEFHLLNNLPDGFDNFYKNNRGLYMSSAYE